MTPEIYRQQNATDVKFIENDKKIDLNETLLCSESNIASKFS